MVHWSLTTATLIHFGEELYNCLIHQPQAKQDMIHSRCGKKKIAISTAAVVRTADLIKEEVMSSCYPCQHSAEEKL